MRKRMCMLRIVFGLCISVFMLFVFTVGEAISGPVLGVSLSWPVPSGYTSKPGQDYAQFNDGSPNRHHAGIDIPAAAGMPVVAAAGGIVRVFNLADFNNKTHCFGNAVIIDHNGLACTLYGHLQSISVLEGQYVSQGQQIGTVGNTLGNKQSGTSCGSTGYHLHFELKNNAVLGTTSLVPIILIMTDGDTMIRYSIFTLESQKVQPQ